MILVYRPELENPPMDKECTIGFSFLTGKGTSDYIQIASGVTRDFPEDVWEQIQSYDVVKNLLSLGALRIERDEASTIPAATEAPARDTLSNLALTTALELVEASFNVDQLNRWHENENRIRLRNSIQKRITAITEGNG